MYEIHDLQSPRGPMNSRCMIGIEVGWMDCYCFKTLAQKIHCLFIPYEQSISVSSI